MAACALVLARCGGGAEELDRSAEPTGFEMALDGVGRGISPSGIGFGWVDIAAIRDAGGPAAVREAAAALAGTRVEAAGFITTRRYTERGDISVLVVTSVRAAP